MIQKLEKLYFMVISLIKFNLNLGQEEVIIWSGKLAKFNKYNWVQERNLVIT